MKRTPVLFCGAIALAAIVLPSATTRAARPAHTVDALGAALEAAKAPDERGIELFPVTNAAGASAPWATLFKTEAACPGDMIEVEGDYCPYVEQRCIRYIDPVTQLRCAEFAPSAACHMKKAHKKFCIDRYEWPNKNGVKPVYMASWREAKQTCESIGKRLCNDSEWTLACEGEEHLPYPYGLKRNSDACNIDKPYGFPDAFKVYNPVTQAAELARLDQREPSGSRPGCVSPYGVHDMAGNVDEWVVNETMGGQPYKSGLKGGYWGPVRTRCRPMTTAHEETFRYYQIGFRCCAQ